MTDIEKFRKRRDKRLRERFDAEIDWITTEEGSHIPLQNGKSIGGWSKGKDFSGAKSEKSKPKGTESPTKEIGREIRKAKDKSSLGGVLSRAREGTKIYVQHYSGVVTGFKKRGNGPYAKWDVILGNRKGEIVPYYTPEIAAKSGANVTTSLKEARAMQSEKYPLRDEKYGTRKKVSIGVTKTTAEYHKGISNTKELFDEFGKNPSGAEIRALRYVQDEGYKADEIGKYDPKKRTVTVTDTKGVDHKYRVRLTGKKITTVGDDGKQVGEPKYDYEYKLVKI